MMKPTSDIKKTTPPSTPCPQNDDDDPEQQQITPQGVGGSTTTNTKTTTTKTTTEHSKSSFSIETPNATTVIPVKSQFQTIKLNVKQEYGDNESDSDDDSFPPETEYPDRTNRDQDLDKLLGIDKSTNNDNDNDNDEERPSTPTTNNTSTGLTTSLNEIADEEFSNHQYKHSLLRCCQSPHPSSSTSPPPKVGNSIILNTTLYRRFSLCIIGPTWPGCLFTIALLYFSSYYFVRKAWEEIGMGSTMCCVGFTIWSTVSLFCVSCKDPGIVREEDGEGGGRRKGKGGYVNVRNGEDEGWRYCDFCSHYQPPNAAHCPDCNVCIEGYDHHCPWMGTCIGEGNMTAFMSFNFSWLSYLLYALIWVSALGPKSSQIDN